MLLTVDSFWGVFWVDVSSKSTAVAGYLRISDVLGSPVQNIDDACHLLSNVKHNWLLVLDNADDPDTDYERYFPSGNRGAILLTSRVPGCSVYNTVGYEHLESLSSTECLTLLLRAAKIPAEAWAEHVPAAKCVVDLLGFHTLALIQAGAYIAQGLCSIEEYPAEYSRQCERLLKFSPKQAQSRYCSIYATFEASALVLESSSHEVDRDALELLQLLAVLHYDNIPLELFEDSWKGARYARQTAEGDERIDKLSKSHVSQLPQFIPVDLDCWDSFRLRRAQAQLQSLALLTKGKHGGSATVSMHPLSHTWMNIRQSQVQKRQAWRVTGCILALSYYGTTTWRSYETCLNVHLQLFLNADSWENISSGSVVVNQMLFQCGRLLNRLCMDSMLQKLLKEIFGGLGMNPIEPLEALLPLYKLLSMNLRNVGKAKDAINVLQQIVHLEELKLTKDHPDRLSSQHELGDAYQTNGQVKEAVQLLEHVVKVRKTTLAEDHPNRLASQHALAIAYQANGQVKEAVQLVEYVAKVGETIFAEDHPNRLSSQHALGFLYQEIGQVKEAVQLLEHVVKVEETIHAEDHPSRLVSQHELGRAYQANGQIKEAVQLLEHVVKVRETTLAEDQPSWLASQYALAIAYEENGQVKEAVQLLEHVVKIRETTLAEDHPDRLSSQHALATAYQGNGQVKEAVQLLEHVVKIRETTLAEDHPSRLASQNALAITYEANGQVKEAVQLLEHVVKIRETTLAEDHPSQLASQHALGRAYQGNGQVKEAVQLLEHVVKVRETTLAEDHQIRLASQHALAIAYQENGQVEEAVQLLEHLVKVDETTLAEDHPDRLASEYALNIAYQEYKMTERSNRVPSAHIICTPLTILLDTKTTVSSVPHSVKPLHGGFRKIFRKFLR